MSDIDQNKWRYQLATEKNYIILDVRTTEEFEQIRLPNSTNIDFYNPPNFIQELEKLTRINPIMCIVKQVIEVLLHVI